MAKLTYQSKRRNGHEYVYLEDTLEACISEYEYFCPHAPFTPKDQTYRNRIRVYDDNGNVVRDSVEDNGY